MHGCFQGLDLRCRKLHFFVADEEDFSPDFGVCEWFEFFIPNEVENERFSEFFEITFVKSGLQFMVSKC